ncbi:MAG: arginine--tRNA ligase [Planctomycetota bacterium]
MLLDRIKEICRKACVDVYEQDAPEVAIDFPDKFGDLALNCFYLAKTYRKGPPMIAAALAPAILERGEGIIHAAEAVSGYVNLTLSDQSLFEAAIKPALFPIEPDEAKSTAKVMVEFSSPNTNKPQHLGHVRNNCLGDSISRILAATGSNIVRANLINDRGIHICKSMLAYQKEGEGKTPQSEGIKGDHFVGQFYVLFEKRFKAEFDAYREQDPGNAEVSKDDFFKLSRWGNEAQQLLQLWENGDEETIQLWKTMNAWVIDGFHQTYADLGISFDNIYLESETYKHGKDIVERGLEKGVFYRRDDGAVEIDLSADKLDKKVVLRSDGTSVYITQDIGTTVKKFEGEGLSRQVWVVGDEQIYHFKVLFKVLEKLGYEWAKDCYHLAYGMVNLPDGKMKSREGKVVDADDLISEVTELAAKEIRNRAEGIDDAVVIDRARKIGLAALKFMILSVAPQTTMTYDPKESVAFDGDTGPYVLYAFARIRRMIEDSGLDESKLEFDATLLGDATERKLALRLLQFAPILERAARDMAPSQICTYLLQLARSYHSHNRQVPILKADDAKVREARLALSRATAARLQQGLKLLGIETVNRM